MITKKISVLLGLAVTISFTACNLTKQEENVISVEIEPSVTIEDNQFDKEENEDIIVQTPETNDDAFVPEEIVSLEPEENDDVINSESDIYNLEGSGYEEIIEMYTDYMKNKDEWPYDDRRISYGVDEKVRWSEDDSFYDELGYILKDLSGDGKPELIVGMEDDFNKGYTRILDLYGMTEDGPIRIMQGASRSRLYLQKDNSIYNEGSDGAADSSITTYRLNYEGTEREKINDSADYKTDGFELLELIRFEK